MHAYIYICVCVCVCVCIGTLSFIYNTIKYSITLLTNNFLITRTWKKAPKAEGIASIGIDQVAAGSNTKFIRWKVHGDWVQQLKYHHDLRQVISCSNHSRTALVIGIYLY